MRKLSSTTQSLSNSLSDLQAAMASGDRSHLCAQSWQSPADIFPGLELRSIRLGTTSISSRWESIQVQKSHKDSEGPADPKVRIRATLHKANSKGQGKGFGMMGQHLAPLPPPATPWVGYGLPGPPMMMMPPQQMPPQMMHPAPHSVPQQPPQPPQLHAPVAPAFQQPMATLDPEHREFLEMARSRQAELPADMRQKVQKMQKKEGAQATKDLHSAVWNLGFARKDVEEAMQARCNMISSWKTFLTDAVKTWQEYATLFQNQERELQERIQQAQSAFAQAKQQAEQSQEEAGKISAIEIKDDDEEIEGDSSQAELTSGKIHEGMMSLTASLQQLQAQAVAIEIEEKAAKRPRTSSPVATDARMSGEVAEAPQNTSASHFVSPGCAWRSRMMT